MKDWINLMGLFQFELNLMMYCWEERDVDDILLDGKKKSFSYTTC